MRSEHAFGTLAPALFALAVLTGVGEARAGFVDERSAMPPAAAAPVTAPVPADAAVPKGAQPAAAAAARAHLNAFDFAGAGWSEAAPRVAHDVPLSSAIAVLMPAAQGAVSIAGSADVLSRKVTWPEGLTRSQAMAHLSSTYSVAFALSERVMRVSAMGAPPAAAAAVAAAVQVAPPASAVATVAAVVVAPAAPAASAAAVPAARPAVAAVAPLVTVVQPTARAEFTVSPSDGVFRNVLKRWSSAAGYTFDDTHWAAPRDVPVAAGASLGPDYKAAVRALLDSTQLTSMPLRPCFYSNAVLRVVPRQEQCDRTPAVAAN